MENTTNGDRTVARAAARKRLRKLQMMTVPVIGVLWLGAWMASKTLSGGSDDVAIPGLTALLEAIALYGTPLLGLLNVLLLEVGIRQMGE